jgi:transketolase
MKDIVELKRIAAKIRLGIIEGVYSAQSGHPGGSLSIAEILAVLYFDRMNIDPKNPTRKDRDRLVLSKGHAAPAYYAALANRGYFSVEALATLRKAGSFLQGHPCMNKIPGVDMSTGSLGQGLSAANGMALAGKMDGLDYRVYCITGDGELQEGQIWEAIMTASQYQLDNLTLFIDCNGLQIDGRVDDIMGNYPFKSKLESFRWHTVEIDGHRIEEIQSAIEEARNTKQRPTAIICKTTKGKGVSFMEDQVGWHGSAPNEAQYRQAVQEISAVISSLEV